MRLARAEDAVNAQRGVATFKAPKGREKKSREVTIFGQLRGRA